VEAQPEHPLCQHPRWDGHPTEKPAPSKAPFYGIILGRIRLNATFGQLDNFQNEPLTFEVVDFPDVNHALLGRLCFAKFMVVPNYTYLKLKMPGPNGVITIEGGLEKAYYGKQDSVPPALASMQEWHQQREELQRRRCLIDRALVRRQTQLAAAKARLAPSSRRLAP
jgi:hypothetical protein